MRNVRFMSVVGWFLVCDASMGLGGYNAPQHNFRYENYWNVSRPSHLAVYGDEVYVASESANKIYVYTFDGTLVREWGGAGDALGQLNSPQGIVAYSNFLYVADSGNKRIQVFRCDGSSVMAWGEAGTTNGQFGVLGGIDVDLNFIYVADSGNNRVQLFTHDGLFVRAWGRPGALVGEFNNPVDVAVDAHLVYIADRNNFRVQVFTKEGAFVRMWTRWTPSNPYNTYHSGPNGIAVDGSYVYLIFGQAPGNTEWYGGLQVYDKVGQRLLEESTWQDYRDTSPPYRERYGTPRGIAIANPHFFIAANGNSKVHHYRRVFRTAGTKAVEFNCIPYATVIRNCQRLGSSILDIDYIVEDDDIPTVTVYALAFTNDTPSFVSCLPINSFVEGTEANIGTNITVGVTNRISWEVGADWHVNYGDLRIAILAKDDRELLDIHWLHLPAVESNPALTINRYPVTENDLLNLWFWVIASGNTAVNLAGGQVTGVGGGDDGELLASDAGTTTRGREFLFDMLGCHEATAAELVQAREASTPGSVTQWAPRYTLPTGVPKKVNEFGFDSGSTDTDGWWVVKE